jgi:CBS domain-containing protein
LIDGYSRCRRVRIGNKHSRSYTALRRSSWRNFNSGPPSEMISDHHNSQKYGKRTHPHQDLLTLTIQTIIQKKSDLIEVSADESLQTVLALLRQHNISSLPVYDDLHTNSNLPPLQRVYKGIVSVVDVLVYLHRSRSIANENPEEILRQPIRKAIGSTKESSNIFLEEDRTLLASVIDKMCQGLVRTVKLFLPSSLSLTFISVRVSSLHR